MNFRTLPLLAAVVAASISGCGKKQTATAARNSDGSCRAEFVAMYETVMRSTGRTTDVIRYLGPNPSGAEIQEALIDTKNFARQAKSDCANLFSNYSQSGACVQADAATREKKFLRAEDLTGLCKIMDTLARDPGIALPNAPRPAN